MWFLHRCGIKICPCPSGPLEQILIPHLSIVNVDASTNTCANNKSLDIEFNDVLDTIKLCVYYIKKRPKNKGFFRKNDHEFGCGGDCLICLILYFRHRPTYLKLKSKKILKYP